MAMKFLEEIKIQSKEKYLIYFLMSGDEVVYIGQTSCGIRRAFLHHLGTKEEPEKDFTSVKIFSAPENKTDRCALEREMIHHHRPKYNRR